MSIQSRLVEYVDGDLVLEGLLVWDDAQDGPRRATSDLPSTLRELSEVDESKVAAIGCCFGGLCVLDVARTGADIAGGVSFHGIFSPPGNTSGNRISAKVLATAWLWQYHARIHKPGGKRPGRRKGL